MALSIGKRVKSNMGNEGTIVKEQQRAGYEKQWQVRLSDGNKAWYWDHSLEAI